MVYLKIKKIALLTLLDCHGGYRLSEFHLQIYYICSNVYTIFRAIGIR